MDGRGLYTSPSQPPDSGESGPSVIQCFIIDLCESLIMLEDGLSYPIRGDWIGRTIIGALLIFFSWLLIPIIAFSGYLIRVLETTIAGEEEPPAFEDWGDLLEKGIVAIVISIAYSIIPVALYAAIVVGLIGGGEQIGGGAGAGAILLGFLLTLLLFIPLVVFLYVIIPAPLAIYAQEGEIGAAFDFSRLFDIWLSADYLVALIMPIVVGFVAAIAFTILSITVVGLLLVPFVYFYAYVAIFRMFGTAVEKTTPGPAPAEQTAEPL